MTRFWKQLSLAVLLGFVLSGTAVLAHPDHKVLGTVTMVAADHVMVKDRTGKEHTIKLVKTTKVTKNKKVIAASEIANGARVVITVVSDEDFTAKLIEVGVTTSGKRP